MLVPFWRITLLLDLRKDALCFVVDAVRACGHLAITFYFLLPTHVTRLDTPVNSKITA